MSAVLSKTLKDKDMDRIFAEIPCTEDLGLSKPGQLRFFPFFFVMGSSIMRTWKSGSIGISADMYSHVRCLNSSVKMMIYAFLEGKLSDPKLMSRVELSTDISQYKSVCESIPKSRSLSETRDRGAKR